MTILDRVTAKYNTASRSNGVETRSEIFDRFLRLTNLKEDQDRILLEVYIVPLFIPDIPRAMLILHGEKGSAKSTLQTLAHTGNILPKWAFLILFVLLPLFMDYVPSSTCNYWYRYDGYYFK